MLSFLAVLFIKKRVAIVSLKKLYPKKEPNRRNVENRLYLESREIVEGLKTEAARLCNIPITSMEIKNTTVSRFEKTLCLAFL